MYLALENWAKKNNTFKMEAKFISNVHPDDAAAVNLQFPLMWLILFATGSINQVTTLTYETLTNESFVKDALKKAGMDASKTYG